jgi:serine phosphatase RsbU (regulator of sigma subunit)
MIESTARRAHQTMEIDLLPWADPYITQLFQDAMLLGHPSMVEFAADSPASRADRRVQAEARVSRDRHSKAVNRHLPRLAPRTRRIESVRLLARC